MIGKRFSKRWTLTWLLWLVLFIPAFWFFQERNDAKQTRLREEKLEQSREAARAEALRRNAEKVPFQAQVPEASDPRFRTAPTDALNRPTHEHDHNLDVEVVNGVEVIASGELKGMTLDEANAYSRKHLAASKARVEKHHEWTLRKRAYDKRYFKYRDKFSAFIDARLADADAELSITLSVYSMMSPEQLKYAREEALKNMDAEKVEAFFDDLANHRRTTTPEALTQEAQDILKSRESHDLLRRELAVEQQQLALERDELARTKPPIPLELKSR